MIGGNLIKDIIKEERPRETLLKKGETYLSDSELLAILINNGTRDKSAITLAREIIETSDGIRNLSNITVEELSKIKGIGLAKACRIISALELGRRVSVASEMQKFKISSPQDIGNVYMEELRYKKKEIFRVVLLNTKNVIIGSKDISEGSLNASIVHPREVFLEAIKKSANKMILMHNHPSGDPTPSSEDINITKRLISAGQIVGIEILDHVIIGDGSFYSFKENGQI
ncbi:RadC family protein [Acetoanaerobium noterae]|jgi:DNA repair protein RadC|uniref:RadC family protein n=1 Tax=Acetoanaerobium noterae TaxID=745369 RepID=UPI001B6EE8C0|nr:DNA repair protein RadC [Acetoanaerobium noterae]MBP8763050.1 DNA repair protein RadC [Acetoanaerobium sp.]MBP9561826.1 DNA repair protein RadC [Acetoanaerobium sp.]MDK2803504.1 repair protein RadC [Peptostreptococcaceae bacterium]